MDHLEGLKILAPWGDVKQFAPVMTLEYLQQIEVHMELSRNYWTTTHSTRCLERQNKRGKTWRLSDMIRLGSIFLTGNARVSVHGIASAIAFVHLQSLESTNL